jgi:hypothetical protein
MVNGSLHGFGGVEVGVTVGVTVAVAVAVAVGVNVAVAVAVGVNVAVAVAVDVAVAVGVGVNVAVAVGVGLANGTSVPNVSNVPGALWLLYSVVTQLAERATLANLASSIGPFHNRPPFN